MRLSNLIIAGTTLICCIDSVQARTYYLPDYQDTTFGNRSQLFSGQTSTPSCDKYANYYSSIQSGMNCYSQSPISGLSCYYCTACSADYQYTSADCPSSMYDLVDECGGKYSSCICKSSLYPTSSTSSGCDSGYVVDLTSSCADKPSGTIKYACQKDSCDGLVTISDCEAEGKLCQTSGQAECAMYCETGSCLYKCDYHVQYNGAQTCDLGCATGQEISGCPEICLAGGCKTCVPCAAEFDHSTKPSANFVYEICTGCDNIVMYKITGCAVNYANAGTHWCTTPQSLDCVNLGYTFNRTCRTDQKIVSCPFNSAYNACL